MIEELKSVRKDSSDYLLKQYVFIDSNKVDLYLNELFEAVNHDDELDVSYSPKLFIDILSDKDRCENVMSVFDNGARGTVCCATFTTDLITIKTLNMSKLEFVKIIKKLYENGTLKNVPNIKKIINSLSKYIDINSIGNETFETTIDGKKVSIPNKFLIDFIKNGFKEHDFKNEPFRVKNLSKQEFFYVLKTFIFKYAIDECYDLPQDALTFVVKVKIDQVVDSSAINVYPETQDEFSSQVELNQELVDAVFEKMPKSYNQIEKAIYIYIRLCKILNYDEEFYANNQEGPVTKKYENIENIANVTPTNSKVVCYTFASIFGKMLNMIEVNYKLDNKFPIDTYGGGHANVRFAANGYLVSADSVATIIGNDLLNAKVDALELPGLKCENRSDLSNVDFIAMVTRIHNTIKGQDKNPDIEGESFESLLAKFTEMDMENANSMFINKKFDILKAKIAELKLNDQMGKIEKISYILKITRAIFGTEINRDRFRFTVIWESIKEQLLPIGIFSFTRQTFNQMAEYYKFTIDGDFVPISYADLQEGFDNDKYGYIDTGRGYYVPMIIAKAKKKKNFDTEKTVDVKVVEKGRVNKV